MPNSRPTSGRQSTFPRLDPPDTVSKAGRKASVFTTANREFDALFGVAGSKKSGRKGKNEEDAPGLRWKIRNTKPMLFSFGGKDWDLTELKKTALAKSPHMTMVTKSFTRILESKQLDDFIKKGVCYSRWYVRHMVLEKSQPVNQLGLLDITYRPPTLGEASKQTLFNGEDISTDMCRQECSEALRQLAMAYCFLLLFVSQQSQEPAKERAYFECIYSFSKEIITTILAFPGFSPLVDKEFDRLFRSNLFALDRSGQGDDGFQTVLNSTDGTDSLAKLLGIQSEHPSRPESRAKSSRSVRPSTTTRTGRVAGGLATAEDIGRPSSRMSAIRRVPTASASGRPGYVARPSAAAVRPSTRSSKSGGWMVPSEESDMAVVSSRTPPTDVTKNSVESEESHGGRRLGQMEQTRLRRKKISINVVRMARSPLADAVLPPPQRFLFVQTRSNFVGSLVGSEI
ncbi:hypothetical protein HDU85_006284 [Gaertneriomyces sp. JEL0708]|nr:hypothetical protein HDU85_006284 [Gaertneriomyces sp. JEL0708]